MVKPLWTKLCKNGNRQIVSIFWGGHQIDFEKPTSPWNKKKSSQLARFGIGEEDQVHKEEKGDFLEHLGLISQVVRTELNVLGLFQPFWGLGSWLSADRGGTPRTAMASVFGWRSAMIGCWSLRERPTKYWWTGMNISMSYCSETWKC